MLAKPGYAIEVAVPGCSNVRRDVNIALDEIITLEVIFGSDACPVGVRRDALPADGPVARDELIVFVGRRRSVQESAREKPAFNEKFTAQYDVLQMLYGSWPTPTIEFTVYDHYGIPAFSKYDAVVLYVARYGETLVHEKYLFDDVYPTRDGRWAGCGDPRGSDSHAPEWKPSAVEFQPIDVSRLAPTEIEERYPTDRFNVTEGFATCKKGTLAPDLVQFKLDVLRARYAPFDLQLLPSAD